LREAQQVGAEEAALFGGCFGRSRVEIEVVRRANLIMSSYVDVDEDDERGS